ncbi:YbjN domain-containing protein [Pokkaliibacter sp. CJK22405]|uniref:YbjN domain-containing protein n=1 Tax=Pokkaliibacter sp. CJK22405 TaxID=3384615 RepID=UPI00398531E8
MHEAEKLVRELTPDQLEQWLEQAGIRTERCGDCDGYHFAELEAMIEGMECRLFLEEGALLMTSEIEIRPAAILPAVAEMARLNIEYSNIKIFVDLNDNAMPHLVMGDTISWRAGMNFEQFITFVQETLNGIQLVIEECGRLGYFLLEEDEPEMMH